MTTTYLTYIRIPIYRVFSVSVFPTRPLAGDTHATVKGTTSEDSFARKAREEAERRRDV